MSFLIDFRSQISTQIKQNEPLSGHTTIGIGGPARYLYTCSSIDELNKIIFLVKKYKIKTFVISAGSNILISNKGFDGLALKLNFKELDIINNEGATSTSRLLKNDSISPRHQSLSDNSYQSDLPNSFSANDEQVQVKVGASWKLIPLMQKLHEKDITGLEWFAGIPGTIGGAIYMNIHGGSYFFSDFLESVETIDFNGEIKTILKKDLAFDYDYSYFHKHKQIILNATLSLYKGNINNAKNIIINWGVAKIRSQAQKSCGCIWQNLDKTTQEELNLPTSSVGYVVDKIFNLKGTKKGDAVISGKHAAFIENLGNASFSDVIYLIELVEAKFEQIYGFKPKREIEIIN